MASPLVPLDLSADRVRETVVGLRPYRPSGFRVGAEPFGERMLVHNYGHGGCGVTLCWGTATLALEAAGPAPRTHGARSAAVIGAGAVGLATAVVFAEAGYRVAVYAEAFSPETTTDIAPALWGPTTLYDPARVTPSFLAQFKAASTTAFARFAAEADGSGTGVRWIPKLSIGVAVPAFAALIGEALYPGLAPEPEVADRLGAEAACSFDALMVDTDLLLPRLARRLEALGVPLVRRRFGSLADVGALGEDVVVNCVGLGAGPLFGDGEMLPVRGQITRVAPQPGLGYGYAWERPDGVLYMYPRASGIVLGGTMGYGSADRTPDPGQRAWMLEGHAEIARKLAGVRLGGS